MSNLHMALDYAAKGWPVLPLRPRMKAPACSNGKHDATTDLAVIQQWFGPNPDFNVGILTGSKSRLLVLDLDPRNGSDASFPEFEKKFGRLPDTYKVQTGGGGLHHYFLLPEDAAPVKDRTNVAGFKGIDIKADGYVLAPPSVHPDGPIYVYLGGELALAPDWLIDLASKKSKSPAIAPSIDQTGEIAQGTRNDVLFSLACKLFRNGLGHAAVLAALKEQNATVCNPPMSDAEVEQIVGNAGRYDPNANKPFTDLANAERLVGMLAGSARFEHKSGAWYLWSGKNWARDEQRRMTEYAKAVAELVLAEAKACPDAEHRKGAIRQALLVQSSGRIGSMVTLAQSAPGIPIEFDELDRHPHLLNVRNGTIDLRTGELRPHAQADLISQFLDLEFRPDALCPEFGKFLDEVFCSDSELIGYLQSVFGYAATGETKEQCFFLLHGDGANGKSTLLNAIRATLGDYAKHTPTETLLVRNGSSSNDLVRLAGARFVTASEANADQKLAEAFIKQVTGDEPMTARFLFKEFVTFMPQFKLFLATNHLPHLSGNDPAIWRRVRTVPFNRRFLDHEQDHN